jgi:transposase
MDWTSDEGYGIPIGTHCHMRSLTEVSLMFFTLHLGSFTGKQLYRRLQQAYASGALRLVKRIHALLALAEDISVHDVAEMLALGEQTVRDYRNQFLWRGLASLAYKRPPGRPSKLTKTQRKELTHLIKAGPQAAGYTSGGWHTPMIQDLIQRHFGAEYHPHYICTLMHNLGFSYQKARFVSDHLNEVKRLQWRHALIGFQGLMLQHGPRSAPPYQGYSVFEFNADESQCFRRLGCHEAAGFRDVRIARPPQQSNRHVAQRRHQLWDVPTAHL